MFTRANRLERGLLSVLVLLGTVDILLTVVTRRLYLGTFVTDFLVIGLLVLAGELVYHRGIKRRWTLLAGVLLCVGGLSDLLATLIGLPGVSAIVPKAIWSLGLLLVLYQVSDTAHKR